MKNTQEKEVKKESTLKDRMGFNAKPIFTSPKKDQEKPKE